MPEENLRKIGIDELKHILITHKLWLASSENEGKQADLSNTNLEGSWFIDANLSKANFKQSKLKNANFCKADLRKADFRDAKLRGADCQYVNLSGADLENADFTDSDLSGASLKGANLKAANFKRAKMVNANLEKVLAKNTNFNGAELRGANFTGAFLKNVNIDNANLSKIIISEEVAKMLPDAAKKKYWKSFLIYGSIDKKSPIIRSIEFPPEYHQAGMSILNYFGAVLRKKYPGQKTKIRLDQEDLKVTMTIQPLVGDPEVIEHELDEYGLVMTGQMAPEEYTDDRLLVLELKNELRMAKVRVESQKEIIEYQRTDLTELRRLIDTALSNPAPVEIQTTATSNVQSDISLNIEIAPQISLIQGSLNELKEYLQQGSEEAKLVEELQQGLVQIERSQSPNDIAKSSAMSKLGRFLENVEKAETTAGKIIKTTKDGIDIARQLAGHYNQLAQWCGLPQVPEPFVKRKK